MSAGRLASSNKEISRFVSTCTGATSRSLPLMIHIAIGFCTALVAVDLEAQPSSQVPTGLDPASLGIETVYEYRDGKCQDIAGAVGRNKKKVMECGLVQGSIRSTKFDGGKLHGLHSQYAIWSDVTFSEIDLSYTKFELGRIDKSKFSDVKVERADWRGLQFNAVRFVNVTFNDTDLRGVKMNDVVFENCQLNNVDLSGASLVRVRFQGGHRRNLKLALTTRLFTDSL